MKEVKNYYGEPIMAYQDADLDELAVVIAHAAMLWHAEWKKQGGEDKGTCCGGKGIQGPVHRSTQAELWIQEHHRLFLGAG